MRNFDQIMKDAESLPGNAIIVTRPEAELCVDQMVQELGLDGVSKAAARQSLLSGKMSFFGKQVTVGNEAD